MAWKWSGEISSEENFKHRVERMRSSLRKGSISSQFFDEYINQCQMFNETRLAHQNPMCLMMAHHPVCSVLGTLARHCTPLSALFRDSAGAPDSDLPDDGPHPCLLGAWDSGATLHTPVCSVLFETRLARQTPICPMIHTPVCFVLGTQSKPRWRTLVRVPEIRHPINSATYKPRNWFGQGCAVSRHPE